MNMGFNSDVTVGADVCHVQTEDHGPPECLIETLVYHGGRILHRRTSNYSDLADAHGNEEGVLRRRIEDQHRAVIEAIRAGGMSIPAVSQNIPDFSSAGIRVRLRNEGSCLVGGNVTLDVEVVRRADGQPIGNAQVEARLEGARQERRFAATTDARGIVQFSFSLPPRQARAFEVVICGQTQLGADEIRISLHSKDVPAPRERKL